MSAARQILRKVWSALPLSAGLRLRLGGFIRGFIARPREVGNQNYEWLQATMAANRQSQAARAADRVAQMSAAGLARAQAQRARDLQDYVSLGGRVPR